MLDRGPTTHTFLESTTKQPKTARNAVAGDDSKPIQAEFRLTLKAACDYAKRPAMLATTADARSPGRPMPLPASERRLPRLPPSDSRLRKPERSITATWLRGTVGPAGKRRPFAA
jgi:hypothetical protein